MNTRRQIPQSKTWKVPMKVSTSPDSTRFKVHRLCHLVLSQHVATDESSHSMADSREKAHLTRHHPIHAQNFTIKSHSTAQIPCLRFASTCSDVSIRPPGYGIFVMDDHFLQLHSFNRLCGARRIYSTQESLFRKLARRIKATSTFLFVTLNDVSMRPPCKFTLSRLAFVFVFFILWEEGLVLRM